MPSPPEASSILAETTEGRHMSCIFGRPALAWYRSCHVAMIDATTATDTPAIPTVSGSIAASTPSQHRWPRPIAQRCSRSRPARCPTFDHRSRCVRRSQCREYPPSRTRRQALALLHPGLRKSGRDFPLDVRTDNSRRGIDGGTLQRQIERSQGTLVPIRV